MTNQPPNPYERGSIWRKWDLHLHTPSSIIQDFGGDNPATWNKYIEALKSLSPDISTIAVTDYLFLDGYRKLLDRKNEFPNISLLIPNIEFRLNIFSGIEGNIKRLNFHVLFDPCIPVDVIQEQFLNCLSSAYLIETGKEWQQTPTRRSLEELGKQIKRAAPPENSIQSKSDLEVGFINITYKKEDILKLLDKDCFKGKYITAIGYSEWNQFRWDQSAAEKRTLINESDFFLTSLDDVAQVAEQTEELKINKLKNTILHSSDAHNFDRLGKTKLWIKADPTFAGLKQVMNEPKVRVFIGNVPPNFKHSHQVISKVKIKNSNNWFSEEFEQVLNRDLVAVIGGRGSGKSALAEMIAYGAGSHDESEDSFINKAKQHRESIEGVRVCLEWEDGSETCFNIGELYEDYELIRYLPQKAVEQLCDPKHSEELQRQIENVIFQSLPEIDKLGATDFTELQRQILSQSELDKTTISNHIRDLNKNLHSLKQQIAGLPDRKQKVIDDKAQLDKLNKTLPTLPTEDVKEQETLSKLYVLKKTFEDQIVAYRAHLATIEEIRSKINQFKKTAVAFETDMTEEAKKIDIAEADLFEVEIKSDLIDAVLESKRKEFQTVLDNLKSGDRSINAKVLSLNEDDLLSANLDSLQSEIAGKLKSTKTFETEKIKYQKQKETIYGLEKKIIGGQNEIKKIEEFITPNIPLIERDRLRNYVDYFKLLDQEKQRIEILYKPLQDILSEGTDTDKRLKFEAKITYSAEQHLNQGLEIIDRSRKGNFREIDTLKEALKSLWLKFHNSGFSKDQIERGVKDLINSFIENGTEAAFEIKDQLRTVYNIEDFDNWLFDVSHFSVASSLSFDGTDLHLLSPGQKGIVLLMLYLEIDKSDTRPLLIDQPEDNLDSLSVYNDLIHFFRDRKQYRQIIIVTHNPNLVVNTDTEQVIVANYTGDRTPRLKYTSGSLEDQVKGDATLGLENLTDGIIEHVCNILEGGDKAIDGRVRKYKISEKNFKYQS